MNAHEVTTLTLTLPNGEVLDHALLREEATGNYFTVDASYIEQEVDVIQSPYNNGELDLVDTLTPLMSCRAQGKVDSSFPKALFEVYQALNTIMNSSMVDASDEAEDLRDTFSDVDWSPAPTADVATFNRLQEKGDNGALTDDELDEFLHLVDDSGPRHAYQDIISARRVLADYKDLSERMADFCQPGTASDTAPAVQFERDENSAARYWAKVNGERFCYIVGARRAYMAEKGGVSFGPASTRAGAFRMAWDANHVASS